MDVLLASKRQLIVFAREPQPGRTKTRLCPPLSHAGAAELYACFLADVLNQARHVPTTQITIAHTPESDPAYFARLASDLDARPQHGAGLGARMDAALRAALTPHTEGSAPRTAVIIGSDSPNLPSTYIAAAFAALEEGADVVLGPADDGGYYLIGARAPQPRLLREVPMSTTTVLGDTLRLADTLGLNVALLPTWYDIDTAAELTRLAAELRTAPPEVAPRTRACLDALRARDEG